MRRACSRYPMCSIVVGSRVGDVEVPHELGKITLGCFYNKVEMILHTHIREKDYIYRHRSDRSPELSCLAKVNVRRVFPLNARRHTCGLCWRPMSDRGSLPQWPSVGFLQDPSWIT